MKKIFNIIRALFIGISWTYIYFVIINSLLIIFWNFSIISSSSWKLLNSYWESGGAIKAGKDYLLFTILLLYIPLWIWGWKRLIKVNFLNILLAPIRWYNDYMIRKYGASTNRILLKNMGRSKKIEEEIEELSKPATQVKTDEEVNKIRNAIAEKINSVKHE